MTQPTTLELRDALAKKRNLSRSDARDEMIRLIIEERSNTQHPDDRSAARAVLERMKAKPSARKVGKKK